MAVNKKKLINDPVHGFITIHSELVFDIIQHPYFQRLRRIKQLGLTEFVYPGALHTRFHHALGAMHLMSTAISTLKGKGIKISDKECEASMVAILLHDIGHGPFSHALEPAILHDTPHEAMSAHIMQVLNNEFKGKLNLAIKIFNNTYERKFFNQLVSSQLDVDRLDYLMRDSFYTGVHEGQIGAERLIKMLSVVDDQLVVEEKGIYSIESFLISRRLMYWQVYLHKTVIAAEQMLFKIMERAKELVQQGQQIPANPCLCYFLENNVRMADVEADKEVLEKFISLDDIDIWSAVKVWKNHEDKVLSLLCGHLLNRRLFKVQLTGRLPETRQKMAITAAVISKYNIAPELAHYLVISGTISNHAYLSETAIKVCSKNREVVDVASASDLPNIKALTQPVQKHYLCWPKEAEAELIN